VVRVRAELSIVLDFRDGTKLPARVIDVSLGGMNLRCDRRPEYGEPVRLIVQLRATDDWQVFPAVVRWFEKDVFGVEFEGLDERQAMALAAFVEEVAA
jgi:c-di-GMP-binding flagellar brake protein YcgR